MASVKLEHVVLDLYFADPNAEDSPEIYIAEVVATITDDDGEEWRGIRRIAEGTDSGAIEFEADRYAEEHGLDVIDYEGVEL